MNIVKDPQREASSSAVIYLRLCLLLLMRFTSYSSPTQWTNVYIGSGVIFHTLALQTDKLIFHSRHCGAGQSARIPRQNLKPIGLRHLPVAFLSNIPD